MEVFIILFAAWLLIHLVFGRARRRSEGGYQRNIQDNPPRQAGKEKKVG